MGISTFTMIEIFSNPQDLSFIVIKKNGRYGLSVIRNSSGKMVLQIKPIIESFEQLLMTTEMLLFGIVNTAKAHPKSFKKILPCGTVTLSIEMAACIVAQLIRINYANTKDMIPAPQQKSLQSAKARALVFYFKR